MISVIVDYFKSQGWKWRVHKDGGSTLTTVSHEDVEATINRIVHVMKDEPDGAQISTGRLIVRKEVNTYDVYMLVGSIDKE